MSEILTGPDRGPPKFDWRDKAVKLQAEVDRLNAVISDGAMWIPVGERLPDGRYTVLVFDPEDGGVQPAEFFAGGEPGGGFYGLGELDGRFSHVTHWMPLPGAPK